MSSLKPAIGVAAVIASFALTPVANAETVVPPGNSAATQYTEALPTSAGEARANAGLGREHRSPAKVIGPRNADKLASKGTVGDEVAALTAETAPPGANPGGGRAGANSAGAEKGVAGNGVSSRGGQKPAAGGSASRGPEGSGSVVNGSGGSGLGEVVGQATGTSSGQLGLFLPLVLISTIVWSLSHLWRQRRRGGQAPAGS